MKRKRMDVLACPAHGKTQGNFLNPAHASGTGNKAATNTYPGKNRRNGRPNAIRRKLVGMTRIVRTSRTVRVAMIKSPLGNLIFNYTPQ